MLSIERRRILICSYAARCFDCKDTNSNRRTLEIACKRLSFNYFKDRLVHFNGTVVKWYNTIDNTPLNTNDRVYITNE